MRIIVDAMGGDNAPESAVWGGALAAKEYGEEVLLVGKPEVVANVLKEKGLSDVKGITIMPANDLVDMHDDPATVLRHKPDSSMAVAFKLLKAGEGDAFKDYKTMLQEIVQKNKQETLEYRLAGQSGPDHDKRFTMELLLNSNVFAEGIGKSKKEAEQMAAMKALENMGC